MLDSLDAADTCYARMAELIRSHCSVPGFNETPLDGLRLVYADCHRPREPVYYEPGLVFVVQGHKTGYLDDRVIDYGPGHYLVQAMPVPFECETRVSDASALLGAAVRIDADTLAELVAGLPAAEAAEAANARRES